MATKETTVSSEVVLEAVAWWFQNNHRWFKGELGEWWNAWQIQDGLIWRTDVHPSHKELAPVLEQLVNQKRLAMTGPPGPSRFYRWLESAAPTPPAP
jgi:hypothetical protein